MKKMKPKKETETNALRAAKLFLKRYFHAMQELQDKPPVKINLETKESPVKLDNAEAFKKLENDIARLYPKNRV